MFFKFKQISSCNKDDPETSSNFHSKYTNYCETSKKNNLRKNDNGHKIGIEAFTEDDLSPKVLFSPQKKHLKNQSKR